MHLYTVMEDNDHFKAFLKLAFNTNQSINQDIFLSKLVFIYQQETLILSMFVCVYNVIKIRGLLNCILWWYTDILHPVWGHVR